MSTDGPRATCGSTPGCSTGASVAISPPAPARSRRPARQPQAARPGEPGNPARLLASSTARGLKAYGDDMVRFYYPRGVAVDHLGNLYIADAWDNRVQKLSATGQLL